MLLEIGVKETIIQSFADQHDADVDIEVIQQKTLGAAASLPLEAMTGMLAAEEEKEECYNYDRSNQPISAASGVKKDSYNFEEEGLEALWVEEDEETTTYKDSSQSPHKLSSSPPQASNDSSTATKNNVAVAPIRRGFFFRGSKSSSSGNNDHKANAPAESINAQNLHSTSLKNDKNSNSSNVNGPNSNEESEEVIIAKKKKKLGYVQVLEPAQGHATVTSNNTFASPNQSDDGNNRNKKTRSSNASDGATDTSDEFKSRETAQLNTGHAYQLLDQALLPENPSPGDHDKSVFAQDPEANGMSLHLPNKNIEILDISPKPSKQDQDNSLKEEAKFPKTVQQVVKRSTQAVTLIRSLPSYKDDNVEDNKEENRDDDDNGQLGKAILELINRYNQKSDATSIFPSDHAVLARRYLEFIIPQDLTGSVLLNDKNVSNDNSSFESDNTYYDLKDSSDYLSGIMSMSFLKKVFDGPLDSPKTKSRTTQNRAVDLVTAATAIASANIKDKIMQQAEQVYATIAPQTSFLQQINNAYDSNKKQDIITQSNNSVATGEIHDSPSSQLDTNPSNQFSVRHFLNTEQTEDGSKLVCKDRDAKTPAIYKCDQILDSGTEKKIRSSIDDDDESGIIVDIDGVKKLPLGSKINSKVDKKIKHSMTAAGTENNGKESTSVSPILVKANHSDLNLLKPNSVSVTTDQNNRKILQRKSWKKYMKHEASLTDQAALLSNPLDGVDKEGAAKVAKKDVLVASPHSVIDKDAQVTQEKNKEDDDSLAKDHGYSIVHDAYDRLAPFSDNIQCPDYANLGPGKEEGDALAKDNLYSIVHGAYDTLAPFYNNLQCPDYANLTQHNEESDNKDTDQENAALGHPNSYEGDSVSTLSTNSSSLPGCTIEAELSPVTNNESVAKRRNFIRGLFKRNNSQGNITVKTQRSISISALPLLKFSKIAAHDKNEATTDKDIAQVTPTLDLGDSFDDEELISDASSRYNVPREITKVTNDDVTYLSFEDISSKNSYIDEDTMSNDSRNAINCHGCTCDITINIRNPTA